MKLGPLLWPPAAFAAVLAMLRLHVAAGYYDGFTPIMSIAPSLALVLCVRGRAGAALGVGCAFALNDWLLGAAQASALTTGAIYAAASLAGALTMRRLYKSGFASTNTRE